MNSYETRVKEFLDSNNVKAEHFVFNQSCHSVKEAAEAVNGSEDDFVKNICMIDSNNELIVAIVKGSNRASTTRVAKSLNIEKPRLANGNEIIEHTGFPPSGVPSFDLRKLVESTSGLAKAKKEKIDSIFVKVNIKDSLAKSYAATGKVALSDMGLVQTKLKIINDYEFKYLVTEEHLTSKDDLKQSNESYSAEDILKAFQDAGLPTTDSRDNSHNCVDLECTTLITTEDVSIYEWPSVEKAQEVRAKNFGDAQVGTIIIRMNNKSLDIQKYIDVMNNVVNK